jgi:hypothetical protein
VLRAADPRAPPRADARSRAPTTPNRKRALPRQRKPTRQQQRQSEQRAALFGVSGKASKKKRNQAASKAAQQEQQQKQQKQQQQQHQQQQQQQPEVGRPAGQDLGAGGEGRGAAGPRLARKGMPGLHLFPTKQLNNHTLDNQPKN